MKNHISRFIYSSNELSVQNPTTSPTSDNAFSGEVVEHAEFKVAIKSTSEF